MIENSDKIIMTEQQLVAYQESLIHYSDIQNIIDTAIEEAIEDAIDAIEIAVEDNRIEIARNLVILKLSDEDIASATDLSIKEVQTIRSK